jgi:hypothetical protein
MDLAVPQTRLDVFRTFILKKSLQELAALEANTFDSVNGQKLPLGGLFPGELTKQKWIMISNLFAASSSCQDLRDVGPHHSIPHLTSTIIPTHLILSIIHTSSLTINTASAAYATYAPQPEPTNAPFILLRVADFHSSTIPLPSCQHDNLPRRPMHHVPTSIIYVNWCLHFALPSAVWESRY